MNLIIDIRERTLIDCCEDLIKKNESFKDIKMKTQNLDVGDIIISNEKNDVLIIERKAVSDLIASIKDGRYSEQSFRLNGIEHENHNIIYLIEGSLKSLTTEKQMAYSSIFSINYYKGFSVYRSENVNETAYIILNMSMKLQKEKTKKPYYPLKIKKDKNNEETEENENEDEEEQKYCTVVKKKKNSNITVENFGEIVLCQIPSVSSVTAIAIMKEYKTINNLIEKIKENENCLNEITTETSKGQKRKISKACVKNIIQFLKV
jgi:crossover junction endonuclease MUS81